MWYNWNKCNEVCAMNEQIIEIPSDEWAFRFQEAVHSWKFIRRKLKDYTVWVFSVQGQEWRTFKVWRGVIPELVGAYAFNNVHSALAVLELDSMDAMRLLGKNPEEALEDLEISGDIESLKAEIAIIGAQAIAEKGRQNASNFGIRTVSKT